MEVVLKTVNSKELLEIRSKVLRNNSNFKYCKFSGDNKKSSIHIAALKNNRVIGGVSLLKNKSSHLNLKNCFQLRGMCVLKEFQNNGIGNKLLLEAERYCISFKINNLWMNAREKALNFYLSSNYKDLGISYEIEGIGLHYFLYKKLK